MSGAAAALGLHGLGDRMNENAAVCWLMIGIGLVGLAAAVYAEILSPRQEKP